MKAPLDGWPLDLTWRKKRCAIEYLHLGDIFDGNYVYVLKLVHTYVCKRKKDRLPSPYLVL